MQLALKAQQACAIQPCRTFAMVQKCQSDSERQISEMVIAIGSAFLQTIAGREIKSSSTLRFKRRYRLRLFH